MATTQFETHSSFDINYTNEKVDTIDEKNFTEKFSDSTAWQQVTFNFKSSGNLIVSKCYQVKKVSIKDGHVSFVLRENNWMKRWLPSWMIAGKYRVAIDQKLPVFKSENNLKTCCSGVSKPSASNSGTRNLAESNTSFSAALRNPVNGANVGEDKQHYLNGAKRGCFRHKVHLPKRKGLLQKRIKSIDDQLVAEADFNISAVTGKDEDKDCKVTATTSISSLLPEIAVDNPTIILGVEDVLLKRVFDDEQHLFPKEPETWEPQEAHTITEIKRIQSMYPEAKIVFFSELENASEKLTQAGFLDLDYKVIKRQEVNFLNREIYLKSFLQEELNPLSQVIFMTSSLRSQQAIASICSTPPKIKCPVRNLLMLDKDQSRMKRSVQKIKNSSVLTRDGNNGYETAKEAMFDLKEDAIIENNIHHELKNYTEAFKSTQRKQFLACYKAKKVEESLEKKSIKKQKRAAKCKELRDSFGEFMSSCSELATTSEYIKFLNTYEHNFHGS